MYYGAFVFPCLIFFNLVTWFRPSSSPSNVETNYFKDGWFFALIFKRTFLLIACFQWNRHPLKTEPTNWPRIVLCNPFLKSQFIEKKDQVSNWSQQNPMKCMPIHIFVFPSHQDIYYRFVNCYLNIKTHNYQTLIKLKWINSKCSINI